MSASTYILSSGSTFKTVSLDSLNSFAVSFQSAATDISTDGSKSVRKVVIDNKKAIITVTGTDQNLVANASIKPGQAGALVLKHVPRSAGEAVGAAVTMTFAEAVMVDYSADSPEAGSGNITMTFHAFDSNDDGTIVAYS